MEMYSDTTYDAVIVGAGVSGLLAAHELLSRRFARIMLVDAGLPMEQRRAQTTLQMGGYGGAGLYLGGRLYFGSASLPVASPVSMPERMRAVISGDAFVRRATEVDQLLHELGARAEWQQRPPEPLEQEIQQAAAVGLEYVTSYPSRRLSPEDKSEVLGSLRKRLESRGAQFLFQTEALEALHDGDTFTVLARTTRDGREETARLMARALLLAPGRYGAEWLTRTAQALGAEIVAAPSTIGVRLEVPSAAYDPLTDVNPDPRLQMPMDGDVILKTYATCPGGVVTPTVRYGALVASGTPIFKREERGRTTTFAVLAQPGVHAAQGEWRGGEECARRLNERAPGRLVVQRLGDVFRGQATTAEALAGNSVKPSDPTAIAGALHDVYPQAYWRAVQEFLGRIDRLAPGVLTDDALVYGPAEERFWFFPTDDALQTSVPGLFVAGDGPGQSQGIIQASVAGWLAGEGMARALDAIAGGQRA
ncbi:MAG TPA: FAD-dependent oxidoreductase [Ktedonobacterales bacterium]